MASDKSYLDYVIEQLSGPYELRYKYMFGEYCVYVNNKPIILVCDNTVFLNKDKKIEHLMKDAQVGIPYKGAKERYILDIDNNEFVISILSTLV